MITAVPPSTNPPDEQSDVSSICNIAIRPSKCESTIRSASPHLNIIDAITIMKLHMDALLCDTKFTMQVADEIAMDPSIPANFKAPSEACVSLLESTVESISEGEKKFYKEIMSKEVLDKLTSALKKYVKCTRPLENGMVPQLSILADEIVQKMNNALKINMKYWKIESDKDL